MKQESIDKIIEMYDGWERGVRSFSCTECKKEVNPADCHGCPIYSQSFSDD